MKILRGCFAAKLIAILLLCILVLIFFAGCGCVWLVQSANGYNTSLDMAERELVSSLGENYLYRVGEYYVDRNYPPEDIFPETNLRFTITDADGNELFSNETDVPVLWSGSVTYGSYLNTGSFYSLPNHPVVTPTPRPTQMPAEPTAAESEVPDTDLPAVYHAPSPTEIPVVTPTPAPSVITGAEDESDDDPVFIRYVIHGSVLKDLPASDEFAFRVHMLDTLYSLRYIAIAIAAFCFLLGILLFVFLLGAAGHRDASDLVQANFLDRIPYDLFTLLCFTLFFSNPLILSGGFGNGVPAILLTAASILWMGLILLLFCMSTATRIKLRTLWQSCLLLRLFRSVFHRIGKLFSGLIALLRKAPLVQRNILLVCGLLIAEFLLLAIMPSFDSDIAFALILKDLLLLPGILWLLLSFRRLRLGARALADGSLDSRVSTDRLVLDLKDHAEDLNRIGEGMNRAVEERLKSERMRTELITNVSHDIKTPLTSIINYVDLLEKEPIENEKAAEYLEVLSRQSAKLKKLIEDLIEASKASTGSLAVMPQDCDLNVLLQQMFGEYEEKFRASELSPVLTLPEESLHILADGRHMWRILDNLLGNVCKYAQSGTRVYCKLEKQTDHAAITLRNISREELNISAEELKERFTRGDQSRSTEGSGLGLSIADSLTALQHGEMDLTVDGDLFKVVLRFPLI